MKKRQQVWIAGIIGLAVWQAMGLFAKDKKLRKNVADAQGVVGKWKILWNELVETNKEFIKELQNTDRNTVKQDIRDNIDHDKKSVEWWIDEKKNAEWVKEGKEKFDSLMQKAPTKSEVTETVETYKQKAKKRWDDLLGNIEKKSAELKEEFKEIKEDIQDVKKEFKESKEESKKSNK